MAIYESHKQEPWFSLIASREKSIEGRVRKGKWEKIKPGDSLIVYSPEEKDALKTEVLAVRCYDTFRDMLEKEDIDQVLPGVKDIETGVETYRKIYAKNEDKNFGVVAVEIKIIE